MIIIDCPICGIQKKITDSIVCDNCGWLHILYINKMPDNIREYLSKKYISVKKQKEKIHELEEKIEELNGESKRLTIELEKQRHKYYVEKNKLDKINENIEKERKSPLIDFNTVIYKQKIATVEEKIKELNALIIKSKQKHSNENKITDILYSLKNNELKVKSHFINKPILLPNLALGISVKKDIQLVSEADFVFKIEVGELKPEIEKTIRIEQLNFNYQSCTVSFFKASDTQFFALKINEK